MAKFYQSKKFWFAIGGAVVEIVNHVFNLGLPDAAILGITMAYVVGQGLADINKYQEIAQSVQTQIEEAKKAVDAPK